MPHITEMSHSSILTWTVGFFFTGLAVYGAFFWYLFRRVNISMKAVEKEVCWVKDQIDTLDKRKVELVVYVDDKERAEQILKTLQTTDRCMLMQRACLGSVLPALTDLKEDVKAVLKNQEELVGIKQVLSLVTERQKGVIERIDGHLNGHSHK